jgi:hypothetical protein
LSGPASRVAVDLVHAARVKTVKPSSGHLFCLQHLDLCRRIARLPQHIGGMLSLCREWRHHLRPVPAGGEPGAAQRNFPVNTRRAGQPRNNVAVGELRVLRRVL